MRDVFVLLRQSPRAFVDQLDFVSSVGKHVRLVVTDLGVLEPDETGELVLTHLHAGATVEQARAATGWPLRVADEPGETSPPSEAELSGLRDLTKGAAR